MRKDIYAHYKDRLIEIGGNNKCLYLKSISKKGAYDIGRILEGRGDKVKELVSFLMSDGKEPFTLICNKEKKQILENLDIQARLDKRKLDTSLLTGEELQRAAQRNDRIRREESNRAVEAEISKIREIKRTVDEVERETGRGELYIGYPFVFGALAQGSAKTIIKAPLLLFPIDVAFPDENTVELSFRKPHKVQINRALIFAYAQSKKLNVEALETEFSDFSSFGDINSIVSYLESHGISFGGTEYESKNIYNYCRFKEPDTHSALSLRYACILTRFPLSNAIYNDYVTLETKHLSNDAINELLRIGKHKFATPKKPPKKKEREENVNYTLRMPDFAQSEVISRVDECGNMVIYGPPGTGKSQTIVNIICDAICKKKKVLVISQKKAALDVVYNRLSHLNSKAMYINDETKEKKSFYERCLAAHQHDMISALSDTAELEKEFLALEDKIRIEKKKLDSIFIVMNRRRAFGPSLTEMYAMSSSLQKNTIDHAIYTKLVDAEEVNALTYGELSEALSDISAKNLETLYYNYLQEKERNPIIGHLLENVDINTLREVKNKITELQKLRRAMFNTANYPYYRQVLTYYRELDNKKNLKSAIALEMKFERDRGNDVPKKEVIREKFLETREAIDAYCIEYGILKRVLTEDGYLLVIDNIMRGNTAFMKYVNEALDNYIALRDINKLISSLDKGKRAVLEFAYRISKSFQNYKDILSKILDLRVYHEITRYEDEYRDELSKTVEFDNITSRINRYKEQQLAISAEICQAKSSRDYEIMYEKSENNKDFLYQISKKQNFWPIRKCMEIYGNFILGLYPCWLLSPENVSNLLPLTKNMFDLVIFDEASQVFIESTIPAIYRGKNIVVAGDDKQLRPSTTFIKRYMGTEIDEVDDYSVQAALEVESLLDLAVSRYESSNLTYHYRSKNTELIDFSNRAFYGMKLQIAPNVSRNKDSRPIERYKVNGKWIDRRNTAEAKKIIEILKNIFATRKNNESIGIITFNADQQTCIADFIDKECSKDPDFRSEIMKERLRFENGEDTGIFVKNLENVQGDERDIIIFSIGYAENELGRIYTNFGSLSQDGGENRLNVAITRAKSKIIVVTSLEPEALKVDGAKNRGPKLLKQYLMYVRAVASGRYEEKEAILNELDESASQQQRDSTSRIETQIKERLEKAGYTVDTGLGNNNGRISIAVYDEELDRYILGIELDKDAFAASKQSLERDISKPRFLENKGWTIIRIWSRDWWLYPAKITKSIISEIESAKKRLLKS